MKSNDTSHARPLANVSLRSDGNVKIEYAKGIEMSKSARESIGGLYGIRDVE